MSTPAAPPAASATPSCSPITDTATRVHSTPAPASNAQSAPTSSSSFPHRLAPSAPQTDSRSTPTSASRFHKGRPGDNRPADPDAVNVRVPPPPAPSWSNPYGNLKKAELPRPHLQIPSRDIGGQ